MTQTLLDAGPSERGWHRIETAARCLRLFAWTQVVGKTFPATEPLIKGSLLRIGPLLRSCPSRTAGHGPR